MGVKDVQCLAGVIGIENLAADLSHGADRGGAGLWTIFHDEHDGVSCQLWRFVTRQAWLYDRVGVT